MTINAELCREVADAMEADALAETKGVGFNMATYRARPDERTRADSDHPCNTVGCIAGYVCAYLGHDLLHMDDHSIRRVAQEALGLSALQRDQLFEPFFVPTLRRITRQQAAGVLRALPDRPDGMADWDGVAEELLGRALGDVVVGYETSPRDLDEAPELDL